METVPRAVRSALILWLLVISLGLTACGVDFKEGKLFLFGSTGKRSLRFAGTWYEAEPAKLSRQIESFLAAAGEKESKIPVPQGQVLAVVAPHAGYMFSGKTAAYSYLAASKSAGSGQKIKRVFLLGPSHYKGFHGAALTLDKSFQTVLGELTVDTEVVEELRQNILFQEATKAHQQEHSLELQLAFIKACFGDVKIVPVLVGQLDDSFEARFIARELRQHLEDGDLVVVSSDFTHFGPRFEYEPFPYESGGRFREKLKALDMEALRYLERNDLEGFMQFYKRTDDTICGVYALCVLLALLPEDSRGYLLDYKTSRDVLAVQDKLDSDSDLDLPAADDPHSVSYMAVEFRSPESSWNKLRETALAPEPLTKDERKNLLKLARTTLDVFVRTGKTPALAELTGEHGIVLSERLKLPHGVFVTLHKNEKGERSLRGCIGYIFPIKPLYQGVIENTISAASRDPRFLPVAPSELKNLEVEVSVLTPPHKIARYEDIKIGEDGILLKCRGRQAVFLPSVATEYGWGLEETLKQLSLKAGLSEDAYKGDAKFEVFRSEMIE